TLTIQAWPSGDDSLGLSRIEVLRNGKALREFIPDPTATFVQTNIAIHETNASWYCVRALGGTSQNRVAVTGAFYFTAKGLRPPAPVPARVHVKIVDAESLAPLTGTVTEVKFAATISRPGKRHLLRNGEGELTVPATVRLRAETK